MKRILLGMMLLAGATAGANAELVFVQDGNYYYDGDVINYDGFQYVDLKDKDNNPTGMYQFKVDPEIHLISTETLTCSVQTQANMDIQLCAGGNCVTGDNITKENVALTADVPLNLQLEWIAPGINFGEDIPVPAITVRLRAWTASESITVTVNMGGFTAGVESITANTNNLVRVNGKTLNYDLSGSSQLAIYSLSGKTVVNKSVAGSGSVNLNHLTPGVYLYKVSGPNAKSGKFIIK